MAVSTMARKTMFLNWADHLPIRTSQGYIMRHVKRRANGISTKANIARGTAPTARKKAIAARKYMRTAVSNKSAKQLISFYSP